MDPIIIVFVILAVAVAAFVSNRIPLAVIAVGVSLALFLTGVLDLHQALAGFGDPTVLFIASLFVVSEALESSGVIAWAGQQVITRTGTGRVRLIVVLSLLTAVITAMISVNGSIAAMLPLFVVVAARSGIPPSHLLMPLTFAAHAGSMLALTGTPVNIIVSDAAADAGERPFGFFEFALAGLPLLAGAILIILFLGRRLLPNRTAPNAPADLQRLGELLRRQYALAPEDMQPSASRGFTEVVIPPRSTLIGMHVFPGMITPSGDLVVLAARRGEELLEGAETLLQAGDVLLLDGTWDDLSRHTSDGREVLIVDHPDQLRRAIPLGRGAKRSMVISGVMVLLLITAVVPPAVAGLLAAGALILSRVLPITQAFREIRWTPVVLVAGMIPLSVAFQETGAAQLIADGLKTLVGGAGPTAALAAIVVLTLVLGQLISNTATVLIVLPVSVALAQAMEVSPLPFLLALAVAGSAAFMTPVATPANLMVMEPGQYRFGDYARFGLPFLVMYFVVAVFWVPVVLPFGG
ncbi:SLC13 family permease [Microbacterium sp. KUDC0406]|uniref:SLC13 family permease n=1 Tax=Microbacterium sp. KUDC0406 TaxID=2909588 RepID=UPI001F249C5C|nr:SLC13 family permease [Microbacterium sp. KUDC0406]UJP08987.1 SLC13 family permease [Microbacterium sp. KUDC0406]